MAFYPQRLVGYRVKQPGKRQFHRVKQPKIGLEIRPASKVVTGGLFQSLPSTDLLALVIGAWETTGRESTRS
jgi:hypothetical protein